MSGFWLGFGTATGMWAFVAVLSAFRMAGLCTRDERRERPEIEDLEVRIGDRWERTVDRWSVN